MGSKNSANSNNFDVVKQFVYLDTAINTNNDVSLEIKRRITLSNRCYFGFNRHLSSRDQSRGPKLILYKALTMFEGKVLSKIFWSSKSRR